MAVGQSTASAGETSVGTAVAGIGGGVGESQDRAEGCADSSRQEDVETSLTETGKAVVGSGHAGVTVGTADFASGGGVGVLASRAARVGVDTSGRAVNEQVGRLADRAFSCGRTETFAAVVVALGAFVCIHLAEVAIWAFGKTSIIQVEVNDSCDVFATLAVGFVGRA